MASPGRVYMLRVARGRLGARSRSVCGLAGEAPLHLFDKDSKLALIIAIIFWRGEELLGTKG